MGNERLTRDVTVTLSDVADILNISMSRDCALVRSLDGSGVLATCSPG